MSSAVFITFLDSPIQHTVPFEGSAISLKDLKAALPSHCGLKEFIFDVHILDKDGTDYGKEDDMIPNNSNLVAEKLWKNKGSFNNTKFKPTGLPPDSYICNKCHEPGHWIYDCPGLTDKYGRTIDFRTVKRPTGIPHTFLLEVSPDTPGAYLTREGKYMVSLKDIEVKIKKKERSPILSDIKNNNTDAMSFQSPICSNFYDIPTSTTYCSLYRNVVEHQNFNNNIPFSVFKHNEYPKFNEIPLQGALNPQLNNEPLTCFPKHSIYQNNKIIYDEEYYERHRKLRKKRSEQHDRHERSRSPHDSHRNKRRHHYNDYDDNSFKHDHRRDKNNYNESREDKFDSYRDRKRSYRDRRNS